jgi:hypothetical protein
MPSRTAALHGLKESRSEVTPDRSFREGAAGALLVRADQSTPHTLWWRGTPPQPGKGVHACSRTCLQLYAAGPAGVARSAAAGGAHLAVLGEGANEGMASDLAALPTMENTGLSFVAKVALLAHTTNIMAWPGSLTSKPQLSRQVN